MDRFDVGFQPERVVADLPFLAGIQQEVDPDGEQATIGLEGETEFRCLQQAFGAVGGLTLHVRKLFRMQRGQVAPDDALLLPESPQREASSPELHRAWMGLGLQTIHPVRGCRILHGFHHECMVSAGAQQQLELTCITGVKSTEQRFCEGIYRWIYLGRQQLRNEDAEEQEDAHVG